MEIKSINYQNETITIETIVQWYTKWSPSAMGEDWDDEDYDLTIDPGEIVDCYFDKNKDIERFIKDRYPKVYEESVYNYDFMASVALVNYFLKNSRDIEKVINDLAQAEYENE